MKIAARWIANAAGVLILIAGFVYFLAMLMLP